MNARVRVPASTANLGPGFDACGLALGLYNEFEATLSNRWRVSCEGEGVALLESGAGNHVARAMRRVFVELGDDGLAAEITCSNGIPVGVGLGSSAAAHVGGLVLGNALCGASLSVERLFELAAEMEGHADNVAAALLGSFTVTTTVSGAFVASCIEPAGGLAVVAAVGESGLSTTEARRMLPATVSHADAAVAAGRAALVALGIAQGHSGALHAGLHDVLHEPYRAAVVPDLATIRELFDGEGVGPAVLSGSGPTVIGLVQSSDDASALAVAGEHAGRLRPALEAIGRHRVLALTVDRAGAVLL